MAINIREIMKHDNSFIFRYFTVKGRIQGGGRGAMAPRSSEGGATIWVNDCQNSLKTNLKYIKITLKIYFLRKSGTRSLRIHKNTVISEGAKIFQNRSFAPPPLKIILYPRLISILHSHRRN